MIDVGSAQRRENISTDMLKWQNYQKSVQHDAVHEVCRHRVEDFPVLAFRILYARSSPQWSLPICVWRKIIVSLELTEEHEIVEIFWDTTQNSSC